jgi:hypothetical protein
MSDHTNVFDHVNSICDTVDAKDAWPSRGDASARTHLLT